VAENVITQKVGPLPLVVWVAGGAGVIGLFILMTHKGNNGSSANQTNQISALAPTEAEAFGTIEQQQQDVTNALTTLGNNQAALGGSINTLSGTEAVNWANANTQFGNILTGQQQLSTQVGTGFTNIGDVLTGITTGISGLQAGEDKISNDQATYYNGLLTNLQNYANSLSGQLNGVNSNLSTDIAVGNQTTQSQLKSYYTSLYDQIVGARYVAMGNATALTAGASDPRVLQWLQLANQVSSQPGSSV